MPDQEIHSIDVASIEKELTFLWKEAEEGDGASPVIRACSLNLLVLGGDDPETEGILDALSVEHPARTFLISTTSDQSSESIEAWVAARCSIPLPGEKQVCCEQIHLRAGGGGGERITSVVTSLLVPDIPVVLWCRTPDRIPDGLFGALQRLCDFTILDSGRGMVHTGTKTPGDNGPLGTSFQLLQETDPVVFGDLSWERTEPWRQLFAHIFDSSIARTELESLTGVRIVCDEQKEFLRSGLPSGMLFTGWLCHTLDLQGERVLRTGAPGEIEGEVTMGGRPVRIVVTGEKPGDEENGPFRSIVLKFNDTEYVLSVNEPGHCFRFVRHGRDGESDESRIPLRSLNDTETLSRLLIVLDSDQMYRKSLIALTKKLNTQV